MFYPIENLKIDLVNVTPDLAQQLIDSTMYERQRPISPDHVERLALEMSNGRFIPGTCCHFAVVKRQLFLINGNHTIRAVLAARVTLPLTFLYTECERMTEVDRLYARHDQHRVRNWAATFKAHGMFERIHADATFVNSAGAAMRYILVGLDRPHTNDRGGKGENTWSRDLRVDAFREYASEVDMLYGVLVNASPRARRVVRRAQFIAVALETYRFQPSKAAEFWSGVANDDGLMQGDPRKALLDWSDHNLVRGAAVSGNSIRATTLAWNAFFEERQLQSVKPASMGEYHLAGTPWRDGERPEMECLKVKPERQGLVKVPRVAPATHIEFGVEMGKDGRQKSRAISVSSRP